MALEAVIECREKRVKEIFNARKWYQITDGTKDRRAEFPLTEIPWLNQELERTITHYNFDDFEAGYQSTINEWSSKKSLEVVKKLLPVFQDQPFESDEEFVALYQAFSNALRDLEVNIRNCFSILQMQFLINPLKIRFLFLESWFSLV